MGSRVAVEMALKIPYIRSQDLPGADRAGEFWDMYGSKSTPIHGSVGSV